jgi:phage host-nuclease inhibitor protein Gam
MTEEVKQAPVPLEKLTRIYIKMRDRRAELTKELDAQIAKLDDEMRTVKTAVLDYMKETGVESLRTEAGIVYRTVKTKYATSDWESMNKFILEHGVPELLVKAINQSNMAAFLEEHPDLLPPGLNANSEYSVTIKRSK